MWKTGRRCGLSSEGDVFLHGITNGAFWYHLAGGMQVFLTIFFSSQQFLFFRIGNICTQIHLKLQLKWVATNFHWIT
jgi:hypothetical protein